MSDIRNLSRTDAEQFFETYYNASNLTIGISGDVEPDRVKALAREYFSRLPEGEEPLPVLTDEPEQLGERRVIIREQSQPVLLVGYHRGGMQSEDDPVYDVLADVLTGGRTSRLHERLVQQEKMLQVQAVPSFPGDKYENLFGLFGFPSRGVSPDSVEHIIYEELGEIQENGITQEELERAKTRSRSDLVGQLDSNLGLAIQFAEMKTLTGDWRNIFRSLNEIEAVTVEDVQRVAKETFERSNRTVGMIKTATDQGSQATAANE
jgi:predicted Zn-dependent peptidase